MSLLFCNGKLNNSKLFTLQLIFNDAVTHKPFYIYRQFKKEHTELRYIHVYSILIILLYKGLEIKLVMSCIFTFLIHLNLGRCNLI